MDIIVGMGVSAEAERMHLARRKEGLIAMYRMSMKWRRVNAIVISVMCLFVGRAFYLLGDVQSQEIGLVFFGLAGNGLITASIYLTEWFTDLDESMKIITFVWVAPFVGSFVGYVLDNARGATFALVIAVLVADTIAIPISVYLHFRDRAEEREHEEEMRKYRKEP